MQKIRLFFVCAALLAALAQGAENSAFISAQDAPKNCLSRIKKLFLGPYKRPSNRCQLGFAALGCIALSATMISIFHFLKPNPHLNWQELCTKNVSIPLEKNQCYWPLGDCGSCTIERPIPLCYEPTELKSIDELRLHTEKELSQMCGSTNLCMRNISCIKDGKKHKNCQTPSFEQTKALLKDCHD